MMCTVHMEGGWDREGVNICRAEVYCAHGVRVGQRGVSIHRGEVYCPHGGMVGQRGCQHQQSLGVLSTWMERGTERGEHPQR